MTKVRLILCFTLSLLILSCDSGISQKTEQALGTVITIKIYQRFKNKDLDELFLQIRELEQQFSRSIDGSEINSINEHAGQEVTLSPEMAEVARTAFWAAEISGGAFDPTIGPLVDLWGIGTSHASVPDTLAVYDAKSRVGYRSLAFNYGSRTLRTEDDTILEFGGIAKGYICDKLVETCREKGLESVLLNLGGNVYALGTKPDGSLFRVGVQDPYSDRGGLIGYVEVKDMAVVTSGIYERYFTEGGVRYHHLLDQKTGYPADNGLAGVTVLCPSSTRADALSTALFVLGLDQGLSLAGELDDVEALFVTEDRSIIMTSGMSGLFVLTNEEYALTR